MSLPDVGLVDTHCHLDHRQFLSETDALLSRAAEAGVTRMLCIGTGEGPHDLHCALDLAARYPNLLATAGVHPHDAAKVDSAALDALRDATRNRNCIAVGEIGLDYHYEFAPRDVQRRVFLDQLRIAQEAAKPIVIHTREAWNDTFEILREHWPTGAGIVHCFTGTAEQALEAVALGFHLGFGGVLTFPKSEALREAARLVPANRLLLETDAPYLAPVPHRGKRNESAFVSFTAHTLAQTRGVGYEEIAAQTTANFHELFRLPHSKPNGYTEDSDGNR